MMKELKPITVNVEELLAVDAFDVDESNPHIELAGPLDTLDAEEFGKLVRLCPAALYKIDEHGRRSFDCAGCLECGTCRIACEGTIIEKWENPAPFMGVKYRFG